MFKNKLNTRITIVGLLAFASCSNLTWYSIPSYNSSETKSLKINNNSKGSSKYSSSGTLSLSFPILSDNKAKNDQENSNFKANKKIFLDPNNPLVRSANESDSPSNSKIGTVDKSQTNPFGTGSYAPLLGFIPVHASFQPADNELWMELERETSTVRVYKGKEKLKTGKEKMKPAQKSLDEAKKTLSELTGESEDIIKDSQDEELDEEIDEELDDLDKSKDKKEKGKQDKSIKKKQDKSEKKKQDKK